jgi:hypothetical protein
LEVQESGEAQIKVLEGEVSVAPTVLPAEDEDPIEELPKEKQFGIPSLPNIPVPEPAPAPAPAEAQPVSNPTSGETVVVRGGEQVAVSPTGEVGLVIKLTQEDFINLLRGDLFSGFSRQIPGLSKIQQTFQRLFPGVPFPISIPGIPGLPIPIRLPF